METIVCNSTVSLSYDNGKYFLKCPDGKEPYYFRREDLENSSGWTEELAKLDRKVKLAKLLT